jgi:hypothetical protein
MKTKTIKQMYDKLNDEVIRKIKAGDFKVTRRELRVVTIEVEGLQFSFWIANGSKLLSSHSEFGFVNTVLLDMTNEDKNVIFDLLEHSDDDRVKLEIKELEEKLSFMKRKLEK